MREPAGDAAAFWRQGIALFNAGKYWEAHEALEQVWRRASEGERGHWQGLIQAAAALLHQSRGNAHGVEALGAAAIGKLRRETPPGFPVETREFAEALARCLTAAGPVPVMREIV